MKKLITLFFLIPIFTFAQSDTSLVTATIQARDWEYIGIYIGHNRNFENLFDSVKVKFRVETPPSGTTNVAITATIGELIGVDILLRRDPYAIGGNVWSRVNTALLAVGNSYMTTRLNDQQTTDTDLFTNNRLLGRAILRKE